MADQLYEKWRTAQAEAVAANQEMTRAELDLAAARARYSKARQASSDAFYAWAESRTKA